LDEIKKSLKGDVKIKLKKEGKGGYSWEITGKDAQEVLKTNEALRKKLSD
jgi:predicted secreted protein